MSESLTPVDAETFRRGMRHVPTVVTIVTFNADEAPCGVTIGSFTSLSLDPPLICFNIKKDSSIHDEIVEADRYLVHVLRDDQAEISDRFADPDRSTRDQLDGTHAVDGPHGIPTLNDFLARFDCRRTEVHEGEITPSFWRASKESTRVLRRVQSSITNERITQLVSRSPTVISLGDSSGGLKRSYTGIARHSPAEPVPKKAKSYLHGSSGSRLRHAAVNSSAARQSFDLRVSIPTARACVPE